MRVGQKCLKEHQMVDIKDITRPVETEMKLCRERFDTFMSHNNELLNAALQHVASRKGKMMRPLLTFLCAKLCGGINDKTQLTALTFEFFHTASLIHDDIVDESCLRRGKASVNSRYDNKVAVLVGDFILANALDTASQTNSSKLVAILSETAKQLADGELLQLSSTRKQDFSEKEYYKVIKGKTAALFRACAEAGAISANENSEHLNLLSEVGENIGICFQMRDDIFDYVAGEEIGKPVGNDMQEGKLTLPVIYALNVTKDAQMLHLAHKVKEGTITEAEIATLVIFTLNAGGIDYANSEMQKRSDTTHQMLNLFPESATVQALHDYVDYVCERPF